MTRRDPSGVPFSFPFVGDPATRLADALDRRAHSTGSIAERDDAVRLVNGSADGFPGVTVDRFGPAVLVEQHRREADVAALVDALSSAFGEDTPIFVKRRWSREEAARRGRRVRGDPSLGPDLVVSEGSLRFEVRLTSGEHVGLFVDARRAREALRRRAAGRRVLNLFSYTCGFGAAAAIGGARSTTNVDNKRSALEAGRRNYDLSGLTIDTRTFVRSDAIDFLLRARRGRGRYDLVVVDPPPRFRRRGGRGFDAREGYGRLVARCLRVLAPGGMLLACLNAASVDDATFTRHVDAASREAEVALRLVEDVGVGRDVPAPSDRPSGRFRFYKMDNRR